MRKRPVISTQKRRPLRPPGGAAQRLAHPLTAVPPYGCGVPRWRASGARRKRGTSGTLVSQMLRAPQRETENRGRPRASLHPDFGRHFAAGINCQVSAALRRARRDAIVNPQAPSHHRPPYSNFACTCRSATKGVLLECALGASRHRG